MVAKKSRRWITIVMVVVVMLLIAILACFFFLEIKHEWYSEEYHREKITELAMERYIENGDYEKVDVYPLYNAEDELEHFLIEFDTNEFIFVMLSDLHFFGLWDSMYTLSGGMIIEPEWRYTRVYTESEEEIIYNDDRYWRKDEERNDEPYANYWYEVNTDGEFVYNTQSPYREEIAKGTDKLYLLRTVDWGYIPAIRIEGNKYFNLGSLQAFEYLPQLEAKDIPCQDYAFYPHAFL